MCTRRRTGLVQSHSPGPPHKNTISRKRLIVANVPWDIADRMLFSAGLPPLVACSVYCIHHAISLPTHHCISILLQTGRSLTPLLTVRPNSHDSFVLLVRVLDFPI